jgi:Flp pilus assembly protein TadB
MDVLSAEDRRKLEAIERGLSRDDPALARAMARGPQAAPDSSRRAVGLTVGATVAAALVAGLLLGPGVLVIAAFLLLIGIGFHAFRGDGDPRPWRRSGA